MLATGMQVHVSAQINRGVVGWLMGFLEHGRFVAEKASPKIIGLGPARNCHRSTSESPPTTAGSPAKTAQILLVCAGVLFTNVSAWLARELVRELTRDDWLEISNERSAHPFV